MGRLTLRLAMASVICFFSATMSAQPGRATPPRLVFKCDVEEHAFKPDVIPPYDYLAISDDGQTLAAASIRGGLAVWNLPEAKPARILEPLAPVTRVNEFEWDLAFLPNSKKLAAVKMHLPTNVKRPPSLRLQIWDVAGAKKLNEFTAPQPDADPRGFQPLVQRPEVAVSKDGAVAAASWSATPMAYDFFKAQLKGVPRLPGVELPKVNTGVTVVSWDLATKGVREKVHLPWGYASIALAGKENKLAAWDGDARSVVLRDGEKTSILADFSGRSWFGSILRLAFSADGRRLSLLHTVAKMDAFGTVSSEGEQLRLTQYNPADGEVVAESELLPLFKQVAAVDDDGTRYAVASDKNTVRIYETATNLESAVVKPVMIDDTDELIRLSLDRTGRYLAASTQFGSISVWDLGAPAAAK